MQAKGRIFKTVARSCLKGLGAFSDMDGQGGSVQAGNLGIDFIEYLLIVEPTERPYIEGALTQPILE